MGAEGAGIWGHPEPLLTCVRWVSWLGSKAREGGAKEMDSSVLLMAWPPARAPAWVTNRQEATPSPPGAGSGRLQDRVGNRSAQTHLSVMGTVYPSACPPPGTPRRDGQLGTRQDASVKGGLWLTGIPHPPTSPSLASRPAGGLPASLTENESKASRDKKEQAQHEAAVLVLLPSLARLSPRHGSAPAPAAAGCYPGPCPGSR